MILLTERLDSIFKNQLQKHIKVVSKGKNVIEGKLILYRIDGFYIYLSILINGELTSFEVPYPFNAVTVNSYTTHLDYRLETLAEKDYNLLFALQAITKRRENKFYNSIIEIINS